LDFQPWTSNSPYERIRALYTWTTKGVHPPSHSSLTCALSGIHAYSLDIFGRHGLRENGNRWGDPRDFLPGLQRLEQSLFLCGSLSGKRLDCLEGLVHAGVLLCQSFVFLASIWDSTSCFDFMAFRAT
jgi:hypothetical protein